VPSYVERFRFGESQFELDSHLGFPRCECKFPRRFIDIRWVPVAIRYVAQPMRLALVSGVLSSRVLDEATNSMTRFSERHGLGHTDRAITIRNDAPEELRGVTLDIAYECGLTPNPIRSLLCRVLRRRADSQNWSEYPNVSGECEDLIHSCEWYEVYDVIEALHARLKRTELDASGDLIQGSQRFTDELNRYFRREGIGWQLLDGKVTSRGTESFEQIVRSATEALADGQRPTARDELHEALVDLSRRPEPDLTGAIQHAMAALECVCRDVCGDEKATLGEIIKRYPGTIPKPLDDAISKAWGYASEMARHVREGRRPDRREVELVVGLAATVATYLTR
jgi:hypothetical protein